MMQGDVTQGSREEAPHPPLPCTDLPAWTQPASAKVSCQGPQPSANFSLLQDVDLTHSLESPRPMFIRAAEGDASAGKELGD